MHQRTRATRGKILLALATLALATAALAAQPAAAQYEYRHGDAIDCGTCHQDNHTQRTPVSEKCLTCHSGYELPDPAMTCWTCHTPGQDMSGQRSNAACTAACHLPGGTTVTHTDHGGGAACTTCHPVAASPADGGGSAHHIAPPRPEPSATPTPAPAISRFTPDSGIAGCPVTVFGSAFGGVTGVTFDGVSATFTPISANCVLAWVPAGASSGAIVVITPTGVGTSTTAFTVVTAPVTPVTARLTLSLARRAIRLGARVRASGRLAPSSLAGAVVTLKVQRRAGGRWVTVKKTAAASSATGAWARSYRPPRRGTYRLRASLAAAEGHTGAVTAWARFTTR